MTSNIKLRTDSIENSTKFKFLYVDTVSVQVRYMAYACGECFPQYRIEKVLFSEADSMDFLNREVSIEFTDKKLEKFVNSCIQQSKRRFIFSGNITRNNYGMMKIVAKKGDILE
jgi:hypothetical protein